MNIKDQIRTGQVKVADLYKYYQSIGLEDVVDFQTWYLEMLANNSSISVEDIKKALHPQSS